jgi:SAM-dependent methyltransferase
LAERGVDVTVVEPNPSNRIFAGPGVHFVPGVLSEALVSGGALTGGSFDVVTFWHSLEHVTDPVSVVARARRLLKPGGSLYVCVPNAGGLQAVLGGNRWAYLDVPRHISHFTVRGLASLLQSQGFGSLRRYGFSAEHEIFGFYQTLLNRISFSHNYFYNRAKKGKDIAANLRFPLWTRAATAAGPVLLPLVILLTAMAWMFRMPVCAEMAARKFSGE